MPNEADQLPGRAAALLCEAAADAADFATGLQVDEPSLIGALAFLLRHGGPARGVEVGAEGWASLNDVTRAVRMMGRRSRAFGVRNIEALVQAQELERFEIRRGRIRALYGHTLPGVVAARSASPPTRLFHGTSAEAEARIREHGLSPMRRGHVHFTSDLGYAVSVARASGGSWIVLRVRSAEAARSGVEFLTTAGHVWLAGEIRPEFLDPLTVARG